MTLVPGVEAINVTNAGADIGYHTSYFNTAESRTEHAGFFRDTTDGKYRVFTGLTSEPSTYVDTTGDGYAVGVLVANIEGQVSDISNFSLDDLPTGSTNVHFTTAHQATLDAKLDLPDILGQVTVSLRSSDVLPAGMSTRNRMAFGFVIEGWTLLGKEGQSGSVVLDIQKDSYTNDPPTGADSIVASAPPTISSANKGSSVTLTGWATNITAGDIVRIIVSSCSVFTELDLILHTRRV